MQTPHIAWIRAFHNAYGRAPRILHVGNINNNAYQTAKMLNARGADCDVLCADYYHIMGNPEWDDADFEGDVGNQFFPALHKLDMHGFERPCWFAQGPRKLTIAYLLARRRGQAGKARRLWRKLTRARRYLVWRSATPLNGLIVALGRFGFRIHMLALFFWQTLRELFTAPRRFWLRCKNKLGRATPQELHILDEAAETWPALQRMKEDAAALFPDRTFTFGSVAQDHIRGAKLFAPLFAQYDIVQCYATDPIWAYLAGCKNYVAYEHGTLRDTVYEDNDMARMSLLAYARAKAVYVTNVDCYDSAVYITKNSGAPIVCGLHGFDTERMMQRQKNILNNAAPFDRTPYAAPDEALFFCPARVDIDPHYGVYLKANDMLYRALARLYKERGGGFRVLQLEWGNDCAVLKRFIAEECGGLAKAVSWHPPFGKAEYYQILQHSAVIFDNLFLRLMGGNGIEAMMNGHAALVNKRIPNELMLRFFPEMWPILAIEDEEDVYRAAKAALDDAAACLALAQQGREWVLKYHSHAAIVNKNCQAYQHVISLLHTPEGA